jgi:hypothetical protein
MLNTCCSTNITDLIGLFSVSSGKLLRVLVFSCLLEQILQTKAHQNEVAGDFVESFLIRIMDSRHS